jgi:hypothetical protein
LPRSSRSRGGNPSTLTASAAPLAASKAEAALAAILRAIEDLPAAIAAALEQRSATRPAPSAILVDYLRPEELAAEFRIRETQLSEWKRKGFGPPRTRIRQLVVYRREAVLRWLLGLEEGHQG